MTSKVYNATLEACTLPSSFPVLMRLYDDMKQSNTLNEQSYLIIISQLMRYGGDHSDIISQLFNDAFTMNLWSDESFEKIESLREELKQTPNSDSKPTIVQYAIANSSITKTRKIKSGGFGAVYSGLWKTQSIETPVAIKEIRLSDQHPLYFAQTKFPLNNRTLGQIYHRFVPDKDRGKHAKVHLCIFSLTDEIWHLSTVSVTVIDGTTKLRSESNKALALSFRRYLKQQSERQKSDIQTLLIEKQLPENFERSLATPYCTVNQRSDLKRIFTTTVELVLEAQMNQEWEALRTEVNLLMPLQHDNIVEFHGITLAEKPYALIMTLYTRGDLTNIIHNSGTPLSTEIIRSFIAQILSAANYLHEQKVIHGDLKPDNILLKDEHSLVVSDFGLSSLSGKQSVRGTPAYMAPELLLGKPGDTAMNTKQSDVYAIGVILWEMLQRTRPWSGRKISQIKMALAKKSTLPIRECWPAIFLAIIRNTMLFDAGKRPTASQALLEISQPMKRSPLAMVSSVTSQTSTLPSSLLGPADSIDSEHDTGSSFNLSSM